MRWQVALVVVLAVAAGCNALGSGGAGTPSPTVTPAPVPTATPTAEPVPSVAPGLSTTGVADPGRLVDSHVRAARNTSWVWTESATTVRTGGDVTVNTTRLQTVRFVDDSTYWREVRRATRFGDAEPDFNQRYAAYADGELVYETWFSRTAARTVYRRNDSPGVTGEFPGFAADRIGRALTLESATVSRIDVGSGTHYEVVGTRERVPGYGRVDAYRARAIVRADGFVRNLSVSYTFEEGGRQVERQYSFRYRRLGNATVDRPDWVDVARNRTSP